MKYIIRQVAYQYNDEYLYVHCSGGVYAEYDNEEEANKALEALKIRTLRETNLGDTEYLSPCACYDRHKEAAKQVKEYLTQKGFPNFVEENQGRYYTDYENGYLPSSLSDEEILHIGDVLGLRFYELAKLEDDENFYALWDFRNQEHKNYIDAYYFFNSEEEAIKHLGEELPYQFNNKKFEGTLEELSETPIVLNTLIESTEELSYEGNILNVKGQLSAENSIALHELLKEKFYEVKPFNLSEAREIEHWQYEQM